MVFSKQQCNTYMKPVIIQPPSYGGPHHAIDTRSAPCDIDGRPLGGSGVLSTATEAAAMSQLCRFITSTVYFPLWSACMLVKNSIDDPLLIFIWISSLSVNTWPFLITNQRKTIISNWKKQFNSNQYNWISCC